jgi:DNA topoisomerase I
MTKYLVIVESPAKSKTLKKYLGKDYEILASYGHIRDLVPKKGAVDTEHDFAMKYQIIEKNARHVENICNALKSADVLLLATDPDREGEAISWHIQEIIKSKKGLKDKPVQRVVFHEITPKAVQAAIANPRDILIPLVNSQQARRASDYLVGFNLSPLLWKKVRRGLSAGRVQSPALRMIAEREAEIEAFITKEYWSIEADLNKDSQDFIAKLSEYNKEKLKQFSIANKDQAHITKDNLVKLANGKLKVVKITKSKRKRNPAAPFTTSTMQQEAVRKLGFSTQKTMRTAQQLYEGIDVGGGEVGLITYMRTDSNNLAEEAVAEIREFIAEKYGSKFVPEKERQYKTKSKNAQEAHEAIRPTSVRYQPDKIKHKLTLEQYKLYDLIWKRTVSCQMNHATINSVAIDFSCDEGNTFRSNGSTIEDPGFIKVYQEGIDDIKKDDDQERFLPEMQEGDIIDLKQIRADQHFTEPPPRFTEATLVKTLEEYGIGRPSTYASIISTLQQRDYVILDKKRFKPTDVGRIVNRFLTSYFTNYVDYDFTAKLEDALDEVSRGEKEWIPLLKEFWKPFIALIKETEVAVQRKDVTQEQLNEKCPECGKGLSIRLGKRGRFIGCDGYPDCKYTRNLATSVDDAAEETVPEFVADRKCPKCDSDLVIKHGKYGKFIGCSAYPKCKHIESLNKPEDTGITCPSCKKGTFIKRKTRYGSFFYPCNKYPDCKYALKDQPIEEPCPQCNWPLMTLKITKRKGTEKICPQKTCGHTEQIESE